MTNANPVQNNLKANAAFLLNSKPTIPVQTKVSLPKNRTTDPSATLPNGKSYPIPIFFEYRAKSAHQEIV